MLTVCYVFLYTKLPQFRTDLRRIRETLLNTSFPRVPQNTCGRDDVHSLKAYALPWRYVVVNAPSVRYWVYLDLPNRRMTATTLKRVEPVKIQQYCHWVVGSLCDHLMWSPLPDTSPPWGQLGNRGWQGKFVSKQHHQ